MKQNIPKRIIVSFTLALGVSLMTLFIQKNKSKKENYGAVDLEAKVFSSPSGTVTLK